jgi:hypothetical protein
MIDIEGITVSELQDICPINRRLASTYVNRLRKYWCPFIVSNGKCNRMCTVTCGEEIRVIVSGIHADAAQPVAVLVWRIRNRKAQIAEQQSAQEKEPIRRNKLGEVVSKNPFEQLRVIGG